jgi:hypothetical protein
MEQSTDSVGGEQEKVNATYPKISPENQDEIDAFVRFLECIRPAITEINDACSEITAGDTARQMKKNARVRTHVQGLMDRNKERLEWFIAKYIDAFLFFDVGGVFYGAFSSDARALEYLVTYSWREAGHAPKTRSIKRLGLGLLTDLANRPIKWIPALQATRI